MKVDIDQSIKIEDTSRDTVIAFSNSISYSKDMILEMLKKLRRKQPRIYFRQIGKKSEAHNRAYLTYKKKLKPDIVLKQKELENLVF